MLIFSLGMMRRQSVHVVGLIEIMDNTSKKLGLIESGC